MDEAPGCSREARKKSLVTPEAGPFRLLSDDQLEKT